MRNSRGLVFLIILIALVVIALIVYSLVNVPPPPPLVPGESPKPTIVPADVQYPAPTVTDGRQVVTLSLALTADDTGKVTGVTLQQAQITTGYAPNLIEVGPNDITTGQWVVELVGSESIRYATWNPCLAEAENTGDEAEPFTYVVINDCGWDLALPLFRAGKALDTRQINIYDEANELVYSTDVNRQEWTRTTPVR
jgi:hypothetical protein